MTTILNIDSEAEYYKTLSLKESVNKIGVWDATLPEVKDITAFASMTAVKDGVTIFGGRLQEPTNRFNNRGSTNKVNGFDYSIKLTDYLTPYSSIVDSDTDTTIDTILTNTPFTYSIESTFGYEYPLIFYDTWLEAMLEIETYVNTTPVISITNGAEINDLVNAGTWTGCNAGLKSTFYYEGETQRFYIFVKNATNDLYYYHSDDGDTWTGVDTGYNPTGNAWSVAWYDDKVYLFIYDGANTDFYRGTITDATGAITFGVSTGNIFANAITFGPVWDDQGDMWVIRDNGLGQAYESTDDGLTFTYRFGPGANSLHGVLPVGSDGDMWGFALDTVNSDLEEWLWDRSAGTFTFTAKIEDEDAVDEFDACCDAAYNWYIVWVDTGDEFWMATDNGGIATDLIHSGVVTRMPTISCDGYYAYMSFTYAAGVDFYKYYEDTQVESLIGIGSWTQPVYMSSPRGYMQDGEVSVFFGIIDSGINDPYFVSFPLSYWRLVEDEVTGSMQTDAITASGGFVKWGTMTSTGVEMDDTLWSVLDASDDSVIVDNQSAYFNLYVAGVPVTVTSIKLLVDITDTGTDPLIYNILLNEYIDVLTLELDYDEVYTALTTWSGLSGGEFWLDEDDVLHLAETRGEDKSDRIILKNSRTILYPSVQPNIKVSEVKTDWTSYVNSIKVLGAGTPPTRAEAEIINDTQVALYGEHWGVLRNKDLETEDMALTAATQALDQRATIIRRIKVDFLDEYSAGDIEIGDTVHLAVLYGDTADGEFDDDVRIVSLNRTFNSNGETVSAECVNYVKANEFYNYLRNVNDLLRWVVT